MLPETSPTPGRLIRPMIRLKNSLLLCALVFALVPTPFATAHTRTEPSFTDTVAATRQRLLDTLGGEKMASMSVKEIAAALTPGERHLLGSTFIHFHISQPARVHVVIPTVKNNDPFWLADRGFTRDADGSWDFASKEYESWSRVFPAGDVGLGTPSLTGTPNAYAVVVTPEKPGGPAPVVDELYPGRLRLDKVTRGQSIYADSKGKLSKAPPAMIGQTLILTLNNMREQGQIQGAYRNTPYPSSAKPDFVTLTWTGEPSTTQTIRWRTNAAVATGTLAYARGDSATFSLDSAQKVSATTEKLSTPDIINDPEINHHTVALTGLEPGTRYTYAVGGGHADDWTKPATFTTAPGKPQSFSFIYLGDAQNGFDYWGRMVGGAVKKHPDAAFVIMAGDLVTRGRERDDWDDLFNNAKGIFDTRPVVPAIGNHEYQGGYPHLYMRHFALRANGPKSIGPGHAYSFEYSNALIIALDSNRDIVEQAAWLEEQLRDTKALWKFVTYHHPAYASRAGRSFPEIIQHWVPLFDKYHVDLALQGHDHAYLRTHPMNNNQRVASPKDGTIYLVSVSGTKLYDQAKHDYTEVGFTKVPIWQLLDLTLEDRTLRYRAYDIDGKLRDEFVITK